ncbi:MAG: MATE family efflux transporter [Ruminococcaceae bacterium]|nr:MATE family efflux transporter [Oscillospiraceae bacterium]
MDKRKARDFTEGALLPQLLMFALPLIATSVLQLLFNTADIIVVGRWGGATPEECETSLAAVGSCGSLINLLVNLFMGLSIGAGVCVAHGIGAKQYEDVKKVVHTSVVAAVAAGAVVTVLGITAARPLLVLMGTDAAVLDEAVLYMIAYFCGMPACMVYNYCAAILRSSGDTVRPLGFLSVAGVINVVLNLIMVLVFHLGAVGVGIATAVSQWVSCALIISFMMKTDGVCRLEIKSLRIDIAKLKRILALGLPAGIQSTLFAVSNVLIQSSINSFGKVFVAGNTAASNIEGYSYVIQNSMYQAAITFVGQNEGAKNYKRLVKCVFMCVSCVTVLGLFFGVGIYLLGEPLLSIYAPENPEAIGYGVMRLAFISLPHFICGLMDVGSGIMRGLGKSLVPTLVSLIGSCALRVVWVYTVFAYFGTPESLFVSYPITWFVTGCVHYVMCFFEIRKRMKAQGECALG